MNCDAFEKDAIVIDNGSRTLRAGLAGNDWPSVTFPSVVGYPKYQEVMPGCVALKGNIVGDHTQRGRGVLALKYPIQRGVVTNWDDMEKIWHHALFFQLNVNPKEHPVLLSEAPLTPKSNREKMWEVMFETFQVPAMHVEVQPVLAMYSAGAVTATVLVSGEGSTHVFPIYEGVGFPNAVASQNLAGKDTTDYLMRNLMQRGYSFTSSADREIVREIKEKVCYVALDFEREIQDVSSAEQNYELPDGQVITVRKERYKCPELMFRPSLLGMECMGVHQLVHNSVMSCPIDTRRDLFSYIMLCGGNTLFPGIADRMEKEIRSLAPSSVNVNVKGFAERAYHVWIGGSVLGSLTCFKSMCLDKQRYDEVGPYAVGRLPF